MRDDKKCCANCWHSMFRNMRGVTVLYCGYYYRAVPNTSACKHHLNSETNE